MAGKLDLGKQVGPLPLGAWIAVVGGGLALAWYVNKSQGSGGDSTLPLLPDSDVGTGGSSSQGGYTYDPPNTGGNSSTDYSTNDEWGRAAVVYLMGQGVNPVTATRAVNKFLGEEQLTADEQALISKAIGAIGPPPVLPGNPPPPASDDSGEPPPSNGGDNNPPPTQNPPDVVLTAPKNLRTWGHGPTVLTVPLQWDPVPGAAYYRVYRGDVAFNVGASADTKTTIGGLTPGKSYTFHVRAVDSKNRFGPASERKVFKTKK